MLHLGSCTNIQTKWQPGKCLSLEMVLHMRDHAVLKMAASARVHPSCSAARTSKPTLQHIAVHDITTAPAATRSGCQNLLLALFLAGLPPSQGPTCVS